MRERRQTEVGRKASEAAHRAAQEAANTARRSRQEASGWRESREATEAATAAQDAAYAATDAALRGDTSRAVSCAATAQLFKRAAREEAGLESQEPYKPSNAIRAATIVGIVTQPRLSPGDKEVIRLLAQAILDDLR